MATKKEVVAELLIEKPTEEKVDVLKVNVILEQENKTIKEKLFSVEQLLENNKQELKLLKKSNEEIVANEHNVKRLLEQTKSEVVNLKNTLEGKDKQIEILKADLTKLANLFDEYIVAYQDQVKMLGVFVKNTQTVEKYLSTKIDEYNGGSKK